MICMTELDVPNYSLIEIGCTGDTSPFRQTKKALNRALDSVPDDLRPSLDINDTSRVVFCRGNEFVEFHRQHSLLIGKGSLGAALQSAQDAGQISSYFVETGQIAIQQDTSQSQEKEWYFDVTANGLGRSLLPRYYDITLEQTDRALSINPEEIEEIIKTITGEEYDPATISIDLYGRTVNVRERGSTKVITKIETGRDMMLEYVFSDIYMQYLRFVDWVDSKAVRNRQYVDLTDPEDMSGILSQFKESRRFKEGLVAEEIIAPQIIDAAIEFGGFENLLREIGSFLDINSQYAEFKFDNEQVDALERLASSLRAQEILKLYFQKGRGKVTIIPGMQTDSFSIAEMVLDLVSPGEIDMRRTSYGGRESQDHYVVAGVPESNQVAEIFTSVFAPEESPPHNELISELREYINIAKILAKSK